MYLVCWNCKQTYPAGNYKIEESNVKCKKCGGTVISPSGKVMVSGVREVIDTVPYPVPDKDKEKDYERIYNNFWKDIVEENGILDKTQVMKELYDFKFMLDEVPKVYEAIANLSKPLTKAERILNCLDKEYIQRDMAVEDLNLHVDNDGNIPFEVVKSYLKGE